MENEKREVSNVTTIETRGVEFMRMHNKTPHAASGNPQFLFVNKDATSRCLSNSRADAASSTAILRHVQRTGKNAAREVGSQRQLLPRPPMKLDTWKSKPLRTPQVPDSLTASDRPRNAMTDLQIALPYNDGLAICETHSQRLCQHGMHVLNVAVVGNSTDPFKRCAVPLDVWKHRILEYFISCWCPKDQIWAYRGTPECYQQDCLEFSDVVRECLASDMHMYALLAVASSRMKFVSDNPLERIHTPESYVVKAIKALRKYLEAGKAVTSLVIMDFHLLASIEVYLGHFENAASYYRIMRHLVDRFGGLGNFTPYVQQVCRSGDLFVASHLGKGPILDTAVDQTNVRPLFPTPYRKIPNQYGP